MDRDAGLKVRAVVLKWVEADITRGILRSLDAMYQLNVRERAMSCRTQLKISTQTVMTREL